MVWTSTIFAANNGNVKLVRHCPNDTLRENEEEYLLPANCQACTPCNTTKCILNKLSFDLEGCATKLFNCLFSSSKEFGDYRGGIHFFSSKYMEAQRRALTSWLSLCFAICDDLEMFPSSETCSCAWSEGCWAAPCRVGMLGTGWRSCQHLNPARCCCPARAMAPCAGHPHGVRAAEA